MSYKSNPNSNIRDNKRQPLVVGSVQPSASFVEVAANTVYLPDMEMKRDEDGFVLPPEQVKRARQRERVHEETAAAKRRNVTGTRGGSKLQWAL